MNEKPHYIEALLFQAELSMREATLDFGMNFSAPHRFIIEPLVQSIRQAMASDDERLTEVLESDSMKLRQAIVDLDKAVYDHNQMDEDNEDFDMTYFVVSDEE